MSFYFRKMRALRLMPSAKRSLGFGFSTRVNEREKNGCGEGEPLQSITSDRVTTSLDTDRTLGQNQMTMEFCASGSSNQLPPDRENCLLLPALPPSCEIVPISVHDLQSVALDRTAALRLSSSHVPFHIKNRDLLDLISGSVKCIKHTSDDILVDPLGFCDDSGFGGRFLHERIAVDILTQDAVKETEKAAFSHPEISERLSWPTSSRISMFDTSDFLTSPLPAAGFESSSAADLFSGHTVYCSSGGGGEAQNSNNSKDSPTPEQMHNARERLEHLVSNLFTGRHDYTLLHKNVTLENNLFGENTVCVGTTRYALEMLKLRFQVHIRYSSTDMEIMNITTLEKNGIIRIHWRLKGVPQTQLLKFWRMFKINKDEIEWVEAFSYFHIGKDGLVHKHRIDRTMPDNEREPSKLTEQLQKVLNPAKPLVN